MERFGMQTLQPILAAHPLFKDLEPRYLEILTGCASNVRFESGAYLLREGEAADQFYLIRQGKVALEVQVPERGQMTIETIEEGEVLGWSWLFPPYRWQFSGRAIGPVRAIALDGACLRNKCELDHDLGYELMRRFAAIIIERLQATRLQMLDVYQTFPRGRL
jgi:CRP/FNR family cyclic AMP-dependent transcriptional regulator